MPKVLAHKLLKIPTQMINFIPFYGIITVNCERDCTSILQNLIMTKILNSLLILIVTGKSNIAVPA